MRLVQRITALVLSLTCGAMLANCSGTAGSSTTTLPSVSKPNSCLLIEPQVGAGGGTGCGGGGSGIAATYYMSGLINWDYATNTGNVTVTDQSGTSTQITGTFGSSQTAIAVVTGGTTVNTTVPTLNANGTTALADGTITVNSSTGVTQAVVTDKTGVQWTITGSPTSTGTGMNVSIKSTSGENWSTVIEPPSSPTNLVHRDDACADAQQVNQFFGNAANIVGGIAALAAVFGAVPLAVDLAGGAGALEIISGVAGLYGFIFCRK
jgi:hypothetical protein